MAVALRVGLEDGNQAPTKQLVVDEVATLYYLKDNEIEFAYPAGAEQKYKIKEIEFQVTGDDQTGRATPWNVVLEKV